MVIDFKRELIRNEAQKVRDWAVRLEDSYDDLCGWCLTCSYLIFKKLDKLNLNPELCVTGCGSSSHSFIYCQGYIVDVTATQFYGIKRNVVVIKNNGSCKLEFWDLLENTMFRSGDINAIEKHLCSWADECNPKTKFRSDSFKNRKNCPIEMRSIFY